MTLQGIAERLAMGSRTNVSNLLAADRSKGKTVKSNGKCVRSENRPLKVRFTFT